MKEGTIKDHFLILCFISLLAMTILIDQSSFSKIANCKVRAMQTHFISAEKTGYIRCHFRFGSFYIESQICISVKWLKLCPICCHIYKEIKPQRGKATYSRLHCMLILVHCWIFHNYEKFTQQKGFANINLRWEIFFHILMIINLSEC